MQSIPFTRIVRCLLLAPLALGLLPARAQLPSATGVPGILHTQDRQLQGNIRWLPVSREYQITAQSGVAMNFRPQQVVRVDVSEPPTLRQGRDALRRNQPDQAIALLDKIAQDYLMLQWDVPATRWLVEAYLSKGDAAAAVRASERITRERPELAYASELAPAYWRALQEAGRQDRLAGLLDLAMARGSRELVARALVMRGNLLRARGETRNALKDGYLRVVLLMKTERAVQPEALFMAMQCFEELGEVSNAERMRKQLLEEHADTEFARRVQAGA